MKTAIIVVLVTFFVGCTTTRSVQTLTKIDLGMCRAEVVQKLGPPTAVRGAIGDLVVYEYRLAMPYDDSAGEIIGKSALTFFTFGMGAVAFKSKKEDYWLFFQHDALASWGRAGDWDAAPRQIYDVRINQSPNLSD